MVTLDDENEIALVRNYVREDKGQAEMCHNFCISGGRGHIHAVYCDNFPNATNYENIGDINECKRWHDQKLVRLHAPKDKYGINVNNIDEFTHEQYWDKVGFIDPIKDKISRDNIWVCVNIVVHQ